MLLIGLLFFAGLLSYWLALARKQIDKPSPKELLKWLLLMLSDLGQPKWKFTSQNKSGNPAFQKVQIAKHPPDQSLTYWEQSPSAI